MTQKVLWELVPDVKLLLELPRDALAGPLIETLAYYEKQPASSNLLIPAIYIGSLFPLRAAQEAKYPREHQRAVGRAISEAWAWLEREGLVAIDHTNLNNNTYYVTAAGRASLGKENFEALRTASRLPREILHPKLQGDVWLGIQRGKNDTAVFEAFREIEIAVREAGGFADSDIGVLLMRKAFDSETGPLTDKVADKGEREALGHLFAGAIGSYKNPYSHRRPGVSDPLDAIEMVMLASHLLRIVDARRTMSADA